MKFTIVSVGKIFDKNPTGIIISEYLKRFPWKIEFKQLNAENSLKKTSQKMLNAVGKVNLIILLDKGGKHYSSKGFASYLNNLNNRGVNKIAFLIGGAEGFHADIYDNVQESISLGYMTYSHKLAKLILVEQLYRSWTILSNHPYPR